MTVRLLDEALFGHRALRRREAGQTGCRVRTGRRVALTGKSS